MCLVSSSRFASLQTVLLIHVKHTNIEIHVLTNDTQYYTDLTFPIFDTTLRS